MKRTQIFSLICAGFALGVTVTSIAAGVLGSSVFPDVPTGSYFDAAVGEMYSDGIITGYADGRFGPNDPVTRGQIAVIMQRFRISLNGSTEGDRSLPTRTPTQRDQSPSPPPPPPPPPPAPTEGSIRFTLTNYNVDEDAGKATISIIRAGGKKGVVSVSYSVTAGTAKAVDDFELASGKITFADGETGRTFTVTIQDDSSPENDETVTLSLSNPTGGAVLSDTTEATLTIKDNDGAGGNNSVNGVLEFSALEYNVAENGDTVTITVVRSVGSDGEVAITYATSNGTAKSGSNYVTSNGTLTFGVGETSKTFTIIIQDNNSINGNKKLTLSLTNPSGGAVRGDNYQVELVIADDEVGTFGNGSFKFAKSTFYGSESTEKAVLVVERTGGTNGEVSIDYGTSDGSAIAGSDYTSTSGTLTFAEGESSKAFIIPITKDTKSESQETINAFLANPGGGAALASPSTASVTIQ